MSDTISDLVASNPPRCLSGHRTQVADRHEGQRFAEIVFSLSCKSCDGSHFSLSRREYEDQFRESLWTTCQGCFETVLLFDITEHGLDGEISFESEDGRWYAEAATGADGKLIPPGPVAAGFTFNATLSELEQVARDENKAVQDLFDWFNVYRNGRVLWDRETG